MESRPNAFLTTGLKVMISGIAFDHPDRFSCLIAFQFDRFKIYTIVPIVLISTQGRPGRLRSSK